MFLLVSDEHASRSHRHHPEGGAAADVQPVQGHPDTGADVRPRVQEPARCQRGFVTQVPHVALHRQGHQEAGVTWNHSYKGFLEVIRINLRANNTCLLLKLIRIFTRRVLKE